MKRQAENFHVVVGMTRLIKMPSYWFGDVLAVVFHIQKMFVETISQPSSCFADVKLVTGGAPYAIDDISCTCASKQTVYHQTPIKHTEPIKNRCMNQCIHKLAKISFVISVF